MSDTVGREGPADATAPGVLAKTGFAVRAVLGRGDTLAVLAGVTLLYLAGYLYAINHLTLGGGGFAVAVVDDPLARLFEPALGTFNFEPVAKVEAGGVTYFASLNTVLGGFVAALVGLNVAITYLAWRQPTACGLGASSAGLLAGVPALLSGSACCGPILLIALGIQASGVLLTTFQFLLPAAVALLAGSLLLVGRQVDPAALDATTGG